MSRKAFLLGIIAMLLLAGSTIAADVVTISHELGETAVTVNPERIVVFDYAVLDILEEMGQDVIGLPKSNVPGFLSHFRDEAYEDVGTLFEPNFERIFELQPDVIFVGGRQRDVYPELSRIAPTVFLTVDNTDYLGSVRHNLTVLGEIFGQEAYAAEVADSFTDAFQAIHDQVTEAGYNALMIMANDGALSAYGPGSRFGVVYKELGFAPAVDEIVAATHGQSISFEFIPEVNPDFLLVLDRAATVGGSITAEQVLDNALIRMSDAYKNDRIVYLSSQEWYVAAGGIKGTRAMLADIEAVLP